MKNIALMRIAPLLAALALAACKEPLYTRLTEQQANEVVGTLLQKDIDASKSAGEEGSWTVAIDRADFARAVVILRESNFPRDASSGLGEVFQKDSLVSSPLEERARMIHALSEELSRTISKIDGVVLARVHVVIATPDPITDRHKPSTASVFIKHRSDADIGRFVPQIKAMVMNAVEGTSYDGVSVALFPTEASSTSPLPTSAPAAPSRLWIWALGVACLAALACALAWCRRGAQVR